MSHSAREAARAAGLTRYETGEPCSKGHIAPRLVSSGVCSRCDKVSRWLRNNGGGDERAYIRYEQRQKTKAAARKKPQASELMDVARIVGLVDSKTNARVRAAIQRVCDERDDDVDVKAERLMATSQEFLRLLMVEKLSAIRSGACPQ